MSDRQSEPRPICGLCGQSMPEGEEMFNYHGYSGPCPMPPKDAPSETVCPRCEGSGTYNGKPCSICDSSGLIAEPDDIAPPSAAPPPADVVHQVVEHVRGDYAEFRERHKIKSGESLSFYQWLDFAVEYARGCYEAGYRDAIQDGAKK